MERSQSEQALERAKELHLKELAEIRSSEELRRRELEAQAKIEIQQQETTLFLLKEEKWKKLQLEHYKELVALGADLTQVLVAERQKPDRFLKVETNPATRLHLHE